MRCRSLEQPPCRVTLPYSPGSIFIYRAYIAARPAFSNVYVPGNMFLTQNPFEEICVMSLHLIAGIDFPSQLPTAVAPLFLLGLNSAGHWVIRETTGRRAGLFRTREAAIKYARDETSDGNFTILHQPQGLELETRTLGPAA
jgi:hypothetical protein